MQSENITRKTMIGFIHGEEREKGGLSGRGDRAGMSLNEWIETTLDAAAKNGAENG